MGSPETATDAWTGIVDHRTVARLPAVRTHLDRMRGPYGLFQHAHGTRPAPEHGSCTDDVARAAMVDVAHLARLPGDTVRADLGQDLAFLEAAFDEPSGRFRNLRSDTGDWLDIVGTQDSHGRAIRGLGRVARDAPDAPLRRRAATLLLAGLPAVSSLSATRPLAYVILGCLETGTAGIPGPDRARALSTAGSAAATLAARFHLTHTAWPWPEEVVTYDNAVLPHALLLAGRAMGEAGWVDLALRTLRWLVTAQSRDGVLVAVGNRGWWPRHGVPAQFDQQPLEAAGIAEAAAAAFDVTHDPAWLDVTDRAMAWFGGANLGGMPLADPVDGSCRDGLGAGGPNENRGAESTLAWLATVELARTLSQATGDPVPVRVRRPPAAEAAPAAGARTP